MKAKSVLPPASWYDSVFMAIVMADRSCYSTIKLISRSPWLLGQVLGDPFLRHTVGTWRTSVRAPAPPSIPMCGLRETGVLYDEGLAIPSVHFTICTYSTDDSGIFFMAEEGKTQSITLILN